MNLLIAFALGILIGVWLERTRANAVEAAEPVELPSNPRTGRATECQTIQVDQDAVLVLQTLGNKPQEALRMVRKAQQMGIVGTQEIVKACCKPRG